MTRDLEESGTIVVFQGKIYPLQGIPSEVAQKLILQLQQEVSSQKVQPLSEILSLNDFERAAEQTLPVASWAYYRTGAGDEVTLRENLSAYQRIVFKPRVLRDVSIVDQTTTLFGTHTASPFYITAFAGSIMGHSQAEKNFTWAAAETDIIQMIPSKSGFPFSEIQGEAVKGQTQWLQVYIARSNRAATELLLAQAKEAGNITTVVFTIDTAQLGKREYEYKANKQSFMKRIPHDPSLNWDDIIHYKNTTGFKIVLKGVQTAEDALKAAEIGVDGIIISNHGGRQLDSARSSIEVLSEVVPTLKDRGLYGRIEILVDGGVRRGSDVVKALCLGASGVGIGRPFLYAMSSHGKEGVVKAIRILQEEVELTLRLLGVNSVSQLSREFIDTRRLAFELS